MGRVLAINGPGRSPVLDEVVSFNQYLKLKSQLK